MLEERTVLSANLPVAVNDPAYVVIEDGVLNGSSVLTNDTDSDSGNVVDRAILSQPPSHGSLALNSNGTFTYIPNSNFYGVDTFTYFAKDSVNGETSPTAATVTITVTAVNDAPVTNGVSFSLSENTVLNGSLSATDVDGDTLIFSPGTTAAAHGTVVINPNGTFSYTPTTNFNGSDSFTFKVSDGTLTSSQATVSLTVTSTSHAPGANPVTISTNEDVAFGGILTGSDSDGDPLTFSAGSITAAHGTAIVTAGGIFVYLPNANYHGSDSFSFKVNDGTSNSSEAIVTVNVVSINDTPVANAATISTNVNTAFTGTLTGSDIDGNSLQFFAGPQTPAHGTVVINSNGTFTYTPTTGYSGTDSFSFIVNDGTTISAPATITVSVTATNRAPVVNNGSATLTQNSVLNGSVTSLGQDADGNSLSYAVVVPPSHGTLSFNSNGQFVYTPFFNFSGTDFFKFKANDGQADSNVGTYNLTVTSSNLPLTVTLPSAPAQVSRNSIPVQIDAAANVNDPDTNVNYSNAQVVVSIGGLNSDDVRNGRVTLSVRNQGTGSGQIRVKGTNIYYEDSFFPVATLRGGTRGSSLVINFRSGTTQDAVNAVLRQLTVQASKKASTGERTVRVKVFTFNQAAQADTTVTIV